MSEPVRKLSQPPSEQPVRNPLLRREPLLDSREAAVRSPVMSAPKMEAKTQVTEANKPKREAKRIAAREYAAVLSAILLISSMISQGAAIIGCAKTVIDGQRQQAPVVTLDSAVKSSQTAAPVVAPKKAVSNDQMSNVSIAPVPPKPDPSSNVSIIAPNFYSNVTMP